MAAIATDTGFIVWGIDRVAYGPVELPTLVSWVKDERVTADTWVYAASSLLNNGCFREGFSMYYGVVIENIS